MSKEKLTPWFPGNVKPARKGVYQQFSGSGREIGYQLWNGRRWGGWYETPEAAARDPLGAASSYQNDKWRGLATPPKAKP